MPKYSIIVPIYKAEKTIEECINSILKQKIKDFEVLLVNDCSPDNSVQICQRYAEQNDRIKIIQQEINKGVSAARNRGIDEATGEYILFIDSDDFVADDYLAVIEDNIKNNPTDLFSFGMYMYYNYPNEAITMEKSDMNCNVDGKVLTNKAWDELMLTSFFAAPWNKVFIKKIIDKHNIRFDEKCVSYEDFIFNCEYCKYINSFAVSDEPIYYYRQIRKSTSAAKRNWGVLFEVSRKVVDTINDFLDVRKEIDLQDMKRHALQSYRIEMQYADLLGKTKFKSAVKEICKDKCFMDVITSISVCKKFTILLRIAIALHIYPLEYWLIRKMI